MFRQPLTGLPTDVSKAGAGSDPPKYIAIAATALLSAAASAGPLVIEETARIVSPNPTLPIQYLAEWNHAHYASRIGVFGDELLVSGIANTPDGRDRAYEAWLFQRSGSGIWHPVLPLNYSERDEYFAPPMGIAIGANIAVAGAVFARTANGWVKVVDRQLGEDSEISSGLVIDSDTFAGWSASIYGIDGASGWQTLAKLAVPDVYPYDDGEFHGGDVDISGSQVIIAAPYGADITEQYFFPPSASIFEGGPKNWTRTAVLEGTEGEPVTIDNGTAIVGTFGAKVFSKAGGTWSLSDLLQSSNQYMRGGMHSAELEGDLAVFGYSDDDMRGGDSGTVSVWQRSADGKFKEVATLVASDQGRDLGYDVDIDGRRVVATANGAAYIWDLPENLSQPEVVQDDFEDGNDAGWIRLPGSTFSVVNTPQGRTYRQTSLAGDAASYVDTGLWMNQAIEADITATQFSGSDRWFGLVVRRANDQFYYYVTVRQSNVIALKSMRDGHFETLASKSFPVSLNRSYRIRLEAIGTRLRVLVDGALQLEATGAAISAGQAGIQMYRTSAQYDNVVVTPNPLLPLYVDDFESTRGDRWTHSGNGNWSTVSDGSKVLLQSDTRMSTGARAITGIATEDQVIEVRVKPTTFDNSTNPWLGLITRYVDDNNYYYVTLRKDGNISLRKLVNGAIHILQTRPFTTRIGRWYKLRMESVGDKLRVYVDGVPTLQAQDATFDRGKYGLMTYRTAAEYDDVNVHSP
jgi:hypothetical protein